MKIGEALEGARGQIVWIVALALSTAAIIHLEQLDVGAPVNAATGEVPLQIVPDAQTRAKEALQQAEARLTLSPDDPGSAASLVLALAVAVQTGSLDILDARKRAKAVSDTAAMAGPEWQPVILLADLSFGR